VFSLLVTAALLNGIVSWLTQLTSAISQVIQYLRH
jgi:hypothetical protein